jgi:hypothetical protein
VSVSGPSGDISDPEVQKELMVQPSRGIIGTGLGFTIPESAPAGNYKFLGHLWAGTPHSSLLIDKKSDQITVELPPPPLLDEVSGPDTAVPGENIILSYRIIGQMCCRYISLGATIRSSGSVVRLIADDDSPIWMGAVSSSFWRRFQIPPATLPGIYSVTWELWKGEPGASELFTKTTKHEYLTIKSE